MKKYHILKTFNGSQTGTDTDRFEADTTRDLSDSLAKAIGGEAGGFIKAADETALQPAKPANRETKVVTPAETKVDEPDATKTEATEKSLDEMNFNELKALAKTKGIKLFGMSEAKLRAALQPA